LNKKNVKILNKVSMKSRRKALRNNMPKAEIILWSKLKGNQLKDYKFRRQHSIGKFVVDFFCPKLKLVIEVDGNSHFLDKKSEQDYERQKYIESQGIRFLRFTNTDIYQNMNDVLTTVEKYIEKYENHPSHPSLRSPGTGKRRGLLEDVIHS